MCELSDDVFAAMDFDLFRTNKSAEKIYLNVPFSEKDEAKSLGAKWDPMCKRWYYTKISDSYKFEKWIVKNGQKLMKFSDLTSEQQHLIESARNGYNILVDACIGSGKTTTIQVLCNELKDKKILYLTYNRLLKVDAQDKIIRPNVEVNNYHGFAWKKLSDEGIESGISDLIRTFLKYKPPLRTKYDILILDEYQDIDTEISEMLEYIQQANPHIQIIAVGDMKQKIYDKTDLDVLSFISDFLGNYRTINFTKCFRINSSWADVLGRIWEKEINGVNDSCELEIMEPAEVVEFLSGQAPSDILCLGARTGMMSRVLNILENEYSYKFNKKTVYASIREEDGGSVFPTADSAIFTTFDGAKGLERDICVVFDFTEEYWWDRVRRPLTRYEIMRNIFCVAASRGKKKIIFVESKRESLLSEKTISTPVRTEIVYSCPFLISEMFDFKYKEDVDACFDLLEIEELRTDDSRIIDVTTRDGLIDLSPCIGIWQEASFFTGYDIDAQLIYAMDHHPDRPRININSLHSLDEKILALTAYNTCQDRYMTQVDMPFITSEQKDEIFSRLSTIFNGKEHVQGGCGFVFPGRAGQMYKVDGLYDVMIGDCIFELKFKSDVKHEDFLQAACYCVATGSSTGILWNVKTNKMYSVKVPDEDLFLDKVVYAITKRSVKSFSK